MAVWYREDRIRNFFLNDCFYLNSSKTDMVKMIFHVLFLVLETIQRRRWNKLPALSLNSYILEIWWGVLVREEQGTAIYGCLV